MGWATGAQPATPEPSLPLQCGRRTVLRDRDQWHTAHLVLLLWPPQLGLHIRPGNRKPHISLGCPGLGATLSPTCSSYSSRSASAQGPLLASPWAQPHPQPGCLPGCLPRTPGSEARRPHVRCSLAPGAPVTVGIGSLLPTVWGAGPGRGCAQWDLRGWIFQVFPELNRNGDRWSPQDWLPHARWRPG